MAFKANECQPVEGPGLTRRGFLSLTVAGAAMATVAAGAVTKSVAQDIPETRAAQYAMIIDTNKCVGCGLCVQACNAHNELPEDQSYTRVPEQKDGNRTWFLPVQCQHCAEPPCATVCPTKATYHHESGAVLINEKLCVGCKYCMVACPYQARIFDDKRGVADKCSLCLDRVLQGNVPACVQVCEPGARMFGPIDEGRSKLRNILGSGRAKPLHPEFNTQPAVLAYIIED